MKLCVYTDRLLLREVILPDLDAIHAYRSDPEVTRHMQLEPNSLEESRAALTRMIESQASHPRGLFALALVPRELEHPVGVASLRFLDIHAQEAQLGYAIQRRYWNRGYTTEACQALLHVGFEVLTLHRIFTTVAAANAPSVRVLDKLGMRREGHLREHLWINGRWEDSYLFALLAREWRAQPAPLSVAVDIQD